MPKRPCLGLPGEPCGRITEGSRCPEHARLYERGRRPTGWQRYPAEYQDNRAATLAASRTCWICGHDGADQADHDQARAHGGSHSRDNLRPSHGTQPCPSCGIRCNQARGDRSAGAG